MCNASPPGGYALLGDGLYHSMNGDQAAYAWSWGASDGKYAGRRVSGYAMGAMTDAAMAAAPPDIGRVCLAETVAHEAMHWALRRVPRGEHFARFPMLFSVNGGYVSLSESWSMNHRDGFEEDMLLEHFDKVCEICE